MTNDILRMIYIRKIDPKKNSSDRKELLHHIVNCYLVLEYKFHSK